MKIIFIRHGKHKVEGNDYFNARLSDEGINQGKELLSSGTISKPDLIFSSHFPRAKDSAEIVAKHFNMDFIVKDCLGEWKIQELALPFEKFLEEEKLARKDLDLVVSGGESFSMARERIFKCVKDICVEYKDAKSIMVVSHGNVLYLLFKEFLGEIPGFDETKEQIKYFDYGIVEYSNNKFKVLKNIISKPD